MSALGIGAHAALLGRHRRTAVVGGYHWRYCAHRSHRLGLPCWRWFIHDGYCRKHNTTCWSHCPPASPAHNTRPDQPQEQP